MRLRWTRIGVWLVASMGAVWTFGESAAESKKGPRIVDYGPVYDVPSPAFATPLDRDYKAVFDVARSPSEPDRVNPSIETLARFLNMHARAGVPDERIDIALVLHGGAGKDALDHASYRKRFDVDNPNLELLEQLRAAGVQVILCGQTAASRGFERRELAAPVDLALSAMTALVTLQNEGFRLISF